MSLAERTRAAARERPFLLDALRAGVVNYSAAARFLAVDGEDDAVATALRRYADELPAVERTERDARVTMQRRVGLVEAPDPDALLRLGDVGVAPDGQLTAIAAEGDVGAGDLGAVSRRLAAEEIGVEAAAAVDGRLTVVVEGSDAIDALRTVEAAVAAMPDASDRN
ncbi:hypothetical protein SAMN06269185_0826 [Natronoarchaeum philippinense]|uniref:Uncharacterized protein n=1 Tax=Natronoarchaeum philippinense TaxID=558529 RepID=A0A285NBH5_NATPI|nr:hypothetical protein [Natronoarchaeum philippinense]SNZ05316.1 hypothetical protein SAMN06269185_0826 [Natronoarchaeum philippinense]